MTLERLEKALEEEWLELEKKNRRYPPPSDEEMRREIRLILQKLNQATLRKIEKHERRFH